MDHAQLANLLAYCAQVACIAAIGCTTAALLRIDVPGVRFVYWRALVVLCLVLPWIQPTQELQAAATAVATAAVPSASPAAGASAGTALLSYPAVNWPRLLGLLIATGFVARLLWMGAGLFYLRRLRSAGTEAAEDEGVRELQSALGTSAAIRYVPGLTQPVTFGLLRPVVLLPDGLREHDAEIQRAVLAHELVHVRRHDWAWIVGEEVVRAALWFHPAMWWLISRVQLAREEVVDEMAVTITGKRRTYVEALLAFADTTPLAPAPAFARRRHLFHRMTLITREAVMSSKRVVMSCAVMALVVGLGGWFAVDGFPMQQAGAGVTSDKPGPLEQAARPITPENPIPRRLSSIDATYPAEAGVHNARGRVTLTVTLDRYGRVGEARPSAVTLAGIPGPGNSMSVRTSAGGFAASLEGSLQRSPAPEAGAKRAAIEAFVSAALDAVKQWRYDPPADGPITFDVRFAFAPGAPVTATQTFVVAGGAGGATAGATNWTADGAVRVGGSIRAPIKVHDVKPVYPPEAQQARVSGVVIVEARIETDGTVSTARILRSVEGLNEAALEAVQQWKFTPTIVDGKPVPVLMTVTVNFTLQ